MPTLPRSRSACQPRPTAVERRDLLHRRWTHGVTARPDRTPNDETAQTVRALVQNWQAAQGYPMPVGTLLEALRYRHYGGLGAFTAQRYAEDAVLAALSEEDGGLAVVPLPKRAIA